MSSARPDHRRHHPPFLRDLSSPISSSLPTPPQSLNPSPPPSRANLFSSPSPLRSNGSPAAAVWWSPAREEKAREGSPVEGVVHHQQPQPHPQSAQQQKVALITLPPPREVARPEMPRDSVPTAGRVDEEEWVTVFGFFPGDTNLVLREFEKVGIVLRHVPGSRDANWMHILYQSRHDAQKALAKHGQQLNSVLIIGVKPVDPRQRQFLNENTNENYQGTTTVPFPSQPVVAPSSFATRNALAPLSSNSMPNGSCNDGSQGSSGAIASPTKSVLSKVMDLMFGL